MSLPPPNAPRPARPQGTPPPPPDPQGSTWSLRVARVSGIPIYLHFTFLLMVIWFALSDLGMGGAGLVVSMLGLFLCVALHELGHSLVAQRFGYKVRDITLYPIGGVAAIEGSPRPRHELYIALAGPAVNVVIAVLLYIALMVLGRPLPLASPYAVAGAAIGRDPLLFLLAANITLVIFNMIPAFPMDGGRVLRAVLGLSLGKARATRIAATVGQFVAILMALWGLGILTPFGIRGGLGQVIIALFVFFAAGQEARIEETRVVVDDAPVGAAMLREFQTLNVGDSLRRAAEVLLATSQQDFPVVHGDEVAGVLSRSQLLRALAQEGDTGFVAGAMTRDVLFALPDEPLEDYMLRPDGVQRAPVLIRDSYGRLIGMLTLENLMEFLTLRQIEQTREEERETRHAGRR